jgi:hypothetical protein
MLPFSCGKISVRRPTWRDQVKEDIHLQETQGIHQFLGVA